MLTVLGIAPETTSSLIAAGAVVVGAMLGVLITLTATRLLTSHARAEREALEAADRRERAASILGRTRVLLTDMHPDRVAFNADAEATPKAFETLAVRLNVPRDEISIFAAAEEDNLVMGAAARLEVALFNAYASVKWLARDVLAHADIDESRRTAKRHHLRATVLARVVLDRVRGRDVAELEAHLQTLDRSTIEEIDALLERLDRPTASEGSG